MANTKILNMETINDTSVSISFSSSMGSSVLNPDNYTLSGDGKGTASTNPNSIVHSTENTYIATWTDGKLGENQCNPGSNIARNELTMLMELNPITSPGNPPVPGGKIHYMTGINDDMLAVAAVEVLKSRGTSENPGWNNDAVYPYYSGAASFLEVCRLCGSVSISLDDYVNSDTGIANAIIIANELNIPLGINFSPWRGTGSGARCTSNTPITDELLTEVSFVNTRLARLKELIGITGVSVGAFLFTDTRYKEYKETMKTYRNLMYSACTNITYGFGATFEYFDFGGISLTESGYTFNDSFTLDEEVSCWSCPLNKLPYRMLSQKQYQLSVDSADDYHPLPETPMQVTPWISLGSGYQLQVSSRGIGEYEKWINDWDYPYTFDFSLGLEFCNSYYGNYFDDKGNPDGRYAPWNRGDHAVFYQQPFDIRNPRWGRHFIAYVRGSNDNVDLEGLL